MILCKMEVVKKIIWLIPGRVPIQTSSLLLICPLRRNELCLGELCKLLGGMVVYHFQIFQPRCNWWCFLSIPPYLKEPKKRLLGILPQHCIQIRQCLEQKRHRFYTQDFINKKIPSDLKHRQVHSMVDSSASQVGGFCIFSLANLESRHVLCKYFEGHFAQLRSLYDFCGK